MELSASNMFALSVWQMGVANVCGFAEANAFADVCTETATYYQCGC